MPHKKNPDVFELIRAKCNKIQALPNEITMICTNLPSGYHRDLQVIKESFLPAFSELHACLEMTDYMLAHIRVKDHILRDEKYKHLFSVEVVNEEVLQGLPFREAYKKVGMQIENGTFVAPAEVMHTHQGSIGNLCNDKIVEAMEKVTSGFNFKYIEDAIQRLLK